MINALLRRLPFRILFVSLIFLCTFETFAGERSERTPNEFLTTFYGWYLNELVSYKSPVFDDKKSLGKYVSRGAIRRISRGYATGAYDNDYFTKSQDVMDDWLSDISVSGVVIKGGGASAVVMLGNVNKWSLKVIMKKVNGTWLIERVDDLNSHP